MKYVKWTIFVLSFFIVCHGFSQSPYQLNTKKELVFYGVGLTTFAGGAFLKSQTPVFTLNELENLNSNDIGAFDRQAFEVNSLKAHHASDYFWFGSFSLPLLFLAHEKTRRDYKTIATLWGETVFITAGLTMLTKYSVRRARPFVYDSNISIAEKTESNAKASFFSGHTSMTAANTFFAATVFSDYFPDSKIKPVVWGLAAAIPAVTGYLRVRGGRHYPTDVIAGYAVGALVGWAIPKLHKRKRLNSKGLSFYGGLNGGMIRYEF